MILWLPHVIVKFPGAFPADTGSQIRQALGLEVYTGHHPLFMTWILKICLWIGHCFSASDRCGIILYWFLQVLFLILIFAYTIYFLETRGISETDRNIIWIVYASCPYIVGYVGVVLKDVLYSAMFLWFMIACIHYLEAEFEICWKVLLELMVSSMMTILTRKNGKEIVYPMLLVICVATVWKNKRQCRQMTRAVLVVVLPILCAALVSNGLTHYYQIYPGSIQEALSLPFQQTARVVRDYGDEIPEEERAIIDNVLQYDSLGKRYNPLLSDPVKNMYNRGTTKEGLCEYAKVWWCQFIRYPLTYVDATLHQNYPLFSLLVNNQHFYSNSNVFYGANGGELLFSGYSVVEKVEARSISFYKLWCDLPIASILCRSSFYCNLLLVLTVIVWCEKKYRLLIVLLPMWLTVGICILGPVINGNPRYTFPIVYSMPLVLGYYKICSKQKK